MGGRNTRVRHSQARSLKGMGSWVITATQVKRESNPQLFFLRACNKTPTGTRRGAP